MKEFFNWKGIITGVVSSLIAAGIFWFLTEKLLWCLSLPLWIWLIVTLFIAIVFFISPVFQFVELIQGKRKVEECPFIALMINILQIQ